MSGFENQLTSGWATWLQHDEVLLSFIKNKNSYDREAAQLLRMKIDWTHSRDQPCVSAPM